MNESVCVFKCVFKGERKYEALRNDFGTIHNILCVQGIINKHLL